MDNWNSNYKILKCFILIVFSYNCSGQVGVRNAFDNRDIYSLNFYSNSNESNNEDSIINGNPYLTPLIDGFRYNAYRDKIVNAEGEAINIDEVTLGDNIFVKKDFYPIWKKIPKNGYLIDLGDQNYIRIQKIIRDDYNPRMNKKSNQRFEQKVTYYRQIDNKIRQIKKNEFDKTHYFIQLGYIQSTLNNYSREGFKNRNSVYYGLGKIFHLKNSMDIISHFFYSKNGGFRYYREMEENGKSIIVYNTIGLELLLKKQINKIGFFTGFRANYALKREQRKASRRLYGFRFRDEYTSLENTLKKIVPLGLTLGISFRLLESINFEVKYNRGLSVTGKNTAEKLRLNSLQTGFTYRL